MGSRHQGEVGVYLRLSRTHWCWRPQKWWSTYQTAHGEHRHPRWRWGWLIWGIGCKGGDDGE